MKVNELIKILNNIQDKEMEIRVVDYGCEDIENLWLVDVLEQCSEDLLFVVAE